ncbi:MAG: hypothetical protein A2521_15680 [Deltaproteobacteria bacterium RIFOXYD12_FULL_57_12]|nr:MAG: hypothetical protein A2521_15680 [Deltaproteobacteria bacterium RIFOXYD12_FULL_57_12]
MKLELLFLGKTREAYLEAGINDFAKRLGRYVPAEIRVLRDVRRLGRGDSDARAMAAEAEILLAAVPKGAVRVVLDHGGRQFSSEQLARQLTSWEEEGRRQVAFLIGGPTGLAPAVLEGADLVISLSRLTFTHELARLILLEQLYRAYTIKAGEQYHK